MKLSHPDHPSMLLLSSSDLSYVVRPYQQRQNLDAMTTSSINQLFDRNRHWSFDKRRAEPDYFKKLSELQKPDYLWIGCSDSRVPANVIAGLEPGEVFVHRNIANLIHPADLNMLSVVEYAVSQLAVKHIIVCGHYGCGGVRAAVDERRWN